MDDKENTPTNASKAAGAPSTSKTGMDMVLRQRAFLAALNSPAEHSTVDMRINEFKRKAKLIPGITKNIYNGLVKEYKQKAWADYAELVKFKGSHPTVTQHG